MWLWTTYKGVLNFNLSLTGTGIWSSTSSLSRSSLPG